MLNLPSQRTDHGPITAAYRQSIDRALTNEYRRSKVFVVVAMTGALAWTLIHFLWEGSLIAFMLAAVLYLLPGASARLRYGLACAALLAMLAVFAGTFQRLRSRGAPAVASLPAPEPSFQDETDLPPAPGPPSPPQDPMHSLVPLWMAGAGFCYLRSIAGWFAAQRLRRAGVCTAPEKWQRRMLQICERLRVKQAVVLLESSLAEVPMVLGWLRPAVLIPAGMLAGFPPEQIECFLLHEIAHIRRWDYLVNLWQTAVEDLLFYHPAVWWVSSRIRVERENCCDDVAVEMADAHGFAAALAALEQSRAMGNPGVAASGGRLVNRIRRLLGQAETRQSGLAPVLLASVSAILIAIALRATDKPAAGLAKLEADIPFKSTPPPPLPLFANIAKDRPLVLLAQSPAPSREGRTAGSAVPAPYLKWLNDEVVYIVTEAERKAFLALSTDEQRQRFIEEFWNRRDPTPGTPENEFREEFYRRLAYADRAFGANGAPGRKTDRGMIYIKYGPPDEREEHPNGGAYERPLEEGGGIVAVYPFEKWLYRYIEGIGSNVAMEFVDRSGTGEYHLTLDPSEKSAASDPLRRALGNEAQNRLKLLNQAPSSAPSAARPQAAASIPGPPLRFYADTTMVIIDVAVKDANGAAVEGLRPGDFSVTEDGLPQRIAVFEFEPMPDSATSYYVLGYYTRNPNMDGGYRTIQVVGKQPTVENLHYRGGYYAGLAGLGQPAAGPRQSGAPATTDSGATPPVPIYEPMPGYSEQARKAKWQGRVLLDVEIDASGHIANVQVNRSLGLGLDEKAVDAVRQWRFRPGTSNGQPANTQAQVEVDFHLL